MEKIECTFDEFLKIRRELCTDEQYLLTKGYVGSRISYDNVKEEKELVPVFLKDK